MHFVMLQAGLSPTSGQAGAVASSVNAVVSLVIYVLYVIGGWKVFTKAERPGWWSIIPIWNAIVLMQISGRSGWWVLGYLVPLFNIFVQIRWGIEMARAFGHGIGFGIGLILLEPLFLIILGFGAARYRGATAHGQSVAPATT